MPYLQRVYASRDTGKDNDYCKKRYHLVLLLNLLNGILFFFLPVFTRNSVGYRKIAVHSERVLISVTNIGKKNETRNDYFIFNIRDLDVITVLRVGLSY